MKHRIYQADAFTSELFRGNPAAVVPLDNWTEETLLQKIAMENNLSETAFYIPWLDGYQIRWFTPETEVDLCGHATLAAAFILFSCENHAGNEINFYSLRSGKLTVRKNHDFLTLNFPADNPRKTEITELLDTCFNSRPVEAYRGRSDYMLVYQSESVITGLRPDMEKITALGARGVIVTARGDSADFVSRFFGPEAGVPEDPVTGSAHTTLVPYWSEKLGKNELKALQVSARRGELLCKNLGDRVEISGRAVLYMTGEIFV
jgi:PhzF family phenazine biosynthesis protein